MPGGPTVAGLLRDIGVVLFRRCADSTLRFEHIEGRCQEVLGLSTATLSSDAYSFWAAVVPSDRQRVLDVLEEALRKHGSYRVEYQLETGAGPIHRVVESGRVVSEPALGEAGLAEPVAIEGIISVVAGEDFVAEHARVEADLVDSRLRFEALANLTGEMVAEIGADGRIEWTSANCSAVLGRPAHEMVGRRPLDWVHPDDREHVAAAALDREPQLSALCRVERADGEWLWLELRGVRAAAEAGSAAGLLMARDATHRVEVEEVLRAHRAAEARTTELTRRLLEMGWGDLDGAIEEGLEAAAAIVDADGCYLTWIPSDEAHRPIASWAWERSRGFGRKRLASDIGRYSWMGPRLQRGEVIQQSSVREMPDELADSRELILESGTRSFCVIPVRSEGRVCAVMRFGSSTERRWPEQEIALVRLVAELLASVLRRREVEQALREGEQRLLALTESAEDAICEMGLGDAQLHYANPRYYGMLGYEDRQDFDRECYEGIHPEDVDRMRGIYQAFVRGDLSDGISGRMLYRARHRDGRWLWLEANGRLFKTAAGEVRAAAVIRDVTDGELARRAMERRLGRETEIANIARHVLSRGVDEVDAGITDALESLSSISHADRSWLMILDAKRNPDERTWEWCVSGVQGRTQGLRGLDADDYPKTMERLLAGREVQLLADDSHSGPGENGLMQRRGCRALLAIPLLANGELIGILGFEKVDQQVTWDEESIAFLRLGGEIFVGALARQQAEQALLQSRAQLFQAQKMEAIGTLAGGVAHDFNNQLSVILGNTRFVSAEVEDESLAEALGDVERAGQHCAQLTRSLLAFARHAPVSLQSLEIGRVLRDVEELMRPLIPSSIEVSVEVHDEDDFVFADPTQLQQVLVNLMVNARDAMPEGGVLTLSSAAVQIDPQAVASEGVSGPGAYLELRIQDSGTGMDPETQARIFEPFFTTKPPGRGTGLGLASVYGLLQESGGAVSVKSALGQGTTFRLLLPQGRESQEPEEQQSEQSGTAPGRVLLVDDEDGVRRLVRRMLEHAGMEVFDACNGALALELWGELGGDIDLLVSDVSMPRMGGLELGRRLLESRPDLSVLLVSGDGEEGHDLPGARSLTKPFTREELLSAVHDLLGAGCDGR